MATMTEAAVTWSGGAPSLAWSVRGAGIDLASATPSIALELEVTGPPGIDVRSVMLRAQVRIAVRRRGYDAATRERLYELFGDPSQWGRSLRDLLWTQSTVMVPPFERRATVTIALPCSYDFEVGTAKYLYGLPDGVVPLDLLLSGTVFWSGDDGELRTALLCDESELRYDLDAALVRRAMDRFFPGSAWIRISRDTFDRLWALRSRRALPTWDHAIDQLLDRDPEEPT
jgi:hypothetical protein